MTKRYVIEVSSKDPYLQKLDNKVLTTGAPIRDLQKMLPYHIVQRGDYMNWNVALWYREPYTHKETHLYYVVTKK